MKGRRILAALDLFLNGMGVFLFLVLVMIPFLNPPTAEANARPPGNLMIHITWPEGNTDVDLWGHAPAEPVPIGYSNRSGVVLSLLRDDLGNWPDATPLNYESMFTRGIVPGEYQFNVHCFRCPQLPIKVDMEITLSMDAGKPGVKASSKPILTTSVELTKNHQEVTAIRFHMDAEGNVDPASMNHVYRPLRAMGKQ